jgi:hypothetical protein
MVDAASGGEVARVEGGLTGPSTKKEPTYLDNKPAVGAPKNWRYGYLTCGCCNDGYGRHIYR